MTLDASMHLLLVGQLRENNAKVIRRVSTDCNNTKLHQSMHRLIRN